MALRTTQSQEVTPTRIADFHEKFKSSLAIHDEMPDLLSRAPLVLNLLGQCRFLAFEESAGPVTMAPTEHLKSKYLSTNLVHLAQLGQDAFHVADSNMSGLPVLANQSFGRGGTLNTILACLSDPEMARADLVAGTDKLSSELDGCIKLVQAIETKFDLWSKAARDLETSVTDTSAQNAQEQQERKQEKLKDKIQLKAKEQVLKQEEKLLDQLEKTTEAASKAYIKASKRKHGVWKDFGFSVLSEVSNTALSVVNTAIDTVRASPAVITEVARAAGNLGSFGGVRIDPLSDNDRSTTDNAPPKAASPAAYPNADDPGYLKAYEIDALVSQLNEIIQNELREDIEQSSKGKLTECLSEIQQVLLNLKDKKDSSQPCTLACGILQTCAKIGNDILDSEKATSDIDDSKWKTLHLDWKARIATIGNDATNLKAQASAQPGRAYGQDIPILKDRGPIDTAGLLARRQKDLLIKQEAMMAMQANYKKSAEKFAANQISIIQITENLKHLKRKKVTMKQIRQILLSTARNVSEMHAQIWQLLKYFQSIQKVIKYTCKGQCRNFVDTIQTGKDRAIADSTTGISLTDLQAQNIFVQLLCLRGHFAVINESAQFYSQISRAHIDPAIYIVSQLPVDSLSIEVRDQAADRLAELTNKSAETIQDIGTKRMNNMILKIKNEINDIASELDESKLPQGSRRAITSGVQLVQDQAIEGIEKRPAVEILDIGDL